MTVTIEEAQANLPGIIAKAEAGEDVLIAPNGGSPTVKLVPVAPRASRLSQHPELKGSLKILDHDALVKPLPPEEWGWLAEPRSSPGFP